MNKRLHALSEKIRKNEQIPLPLAALLYACTPLTRVGMWLRKRETPIRVDARVISFGNITAGGSGKTPAVIERAHAEFAAGRRVAVLTRGYGSAHSSSPIIATAGSFPGELHRMIGDEPAMIARAVPGVFVVKCPDRVAGARAAIEQCGCDALILDDGFQHVRLARDENIVLIDARNPFGNGRLIPRGILREPIGALARATSIILTRCDQAENLEAVLRELERICPGLPIRKTRHAPKCVVPMDGGPASSIEWLCGRRVKAACGIAQPETFFKTLADLGAEITGRVSLPDHSAIPEETFSGADVILITEKDAARLGRARPNVYALRIEIEDYKER
jgi:tetraacyldisaccharide 4'-kinase